MRVGNGKLWPGDGEDGDRGEWGESRRGACTRHGERDEVGRGHREDGGWDIGGF